MKRTPVGETAIAVAEPQPLGLGHILRHPKVEVSDEQIEAAANVEGDPAWDEIQRHMIEASPAFMAQEILQGPPEAPYNGRFLIGEHHIEWDELATTYDRLCVMAPRDHGKCQRGDALILTPEGKRIRIDEWEGGMLYAYDPETHKFVETYAPAARPNGAKPILRVTTKSGRQVVVTENHPLRKLNSWCRADELVVGERIAVPYTSPSNATAVMSDAWLVGLLVGDGGLTGSNVILTTADERVLKSVQAMSIEVKRADKHSHRLLGLQPRMRELKLMGCTSHTKRVPEEVFTSDKESIGEFIAGYLDADATVNKHGGGAVEFYSVSELLLRDVQHLLTRLGVLSVLSQKRGRYQGEVHLSWRLTIRGKDIVTLANHVTPKGERAGQLRALAVAQLMKGRSSGPAIDRFPRDVWKMVQHSEDWFRKQGLPRPATGYEPTREKMQAIAEAEDNTELRALTNADVLWDEVVDIEELGVEETWSIHVPEFSNYLADDVVNHNTFFWDFAIPIWKAVTMPNGIGYIFSATQPQAIRILDDIKNEIESNPKLKWLVPSKKEKWSGTSIRLSNGHTIYARGFGTKVRGAHPNWIVVDDGLNDETMYSELVRKKQIEYFYSAITNMIVPGGQIIVVGTPFHSEDLYAKLSRNKEYKFVRYRAFNGKDEKPLWPERYSRERLLSKREEIGTVRFTREFQCDPISDDMSLFPGYLFRGEPTEQFTMTLGMPKEIYEELGITIFMGVDFAMSSNVSADYTVIWVMGLDGHGNRWVIDIVRGKGLPYQEQLSKINEVGKIYDPAIIFLEANQMQRIFGDELIRKTDLPIKQFVTGVQKNSLDKGVPSLRVLLENGKFRIPRGDKRSIEATNVWINEMRNFTWHDGKLQSVGSHDDTVMGCWICDQAIRQGGFSFDFGEDMEKGNLDEMLKEMNAEDDAPESGNGDGTGNGNGTVSLIDENDPMQVLGGLPAPELIGRWL